jgi:hypothetical protein
MSIVWGHTQLPYKRFALVGAFVFLNVNFFLSLEEERRKKQKAIESPQESHVR